METSAELRARAERLYQQRSLDKLSAKVTDPAVQAIGRQFASGQMGADEFVRQMQRSPALMRGFDRCVKRYLTLTPEDVAAAKAQREQVIDQIVTELAQLDRATRRPQQAARARRQVQDEEESWESRSWLE